MFRAPEWSINARSLWALDVLAEEGFAARCEHGACQARRRRLVSAVSSCQEHAGRTDNRNAAACGRSVRAGHADGMGVGTADELAGRVLRTIEAAESSRTARRPDGASVGTRPEPAAGAPAAATALRPLLPPDGFRDAAPRRAARNGFRPAWRRPRASPEPMKTGSVVLAAAAVLCALGVTPAAAADAAGQRCASRSSIEPAGAALRVLDQAGTVPFPDRRLSRSASPADAELDARLTAVRRRRRAGVAHRPRAGRR